MEPGINQSIPKSAVGVGESQNTEAELSMLPVPDATEFASTLIPVVVTAVVAQQQQQSLQEGSMNADPIISQAAELLTIPTQEILTTIIPAVLSAAVVQTLDDQPLYDVVKKNPVSTFSGYGFDLQQVDKSIADLDQLISALREVSNMKAGSSPGFNTTPDIVDGNITDLLWKNTEGGAYDTLPIVSSRKNNVPQLCVSDALKIYLQIRDIWIQRKRYVEAHLKGENTDNVCDCIKSWKHSPDAYVLYWLANQILEQLMVQEASECITDMLSEHGLKRGIEAWSNLYNRKTCPTPEETKFMYNPQVSIRLFHGRDDFISTFVKMAFATKETLDVSTCYVFPNDLAQRYILLDVLPHISRHRDVKVRLVVDLSVVESLVLRSAFKFVSPDCVGKAERQYRGGVGPLSFLDHLPKEACPFTDYAKKHRTAYELLQELHNIAATIPGDRLQIRYWCARDAEKKYRIKNHTKCHVFDKHTAIIGGSNIVPTVDSGNSDLDLVTHGSIAEQVGDGFEYLWNAMSPNNIFDPFSPVQNIHEEEKKEIADEDEIDEVFRSQNWCDENATVAFLRSEPSSKGKDSILRHILGAITTAKESIYMCMGHSNKPLPLARALADACKRGVKVKMIVNSMYSSDLRVNQSDLFLSLKMLLEMAPEIEVFTTALPSHGKERGTTMKNVDPYGKPPPFLHSKYTVVDNKWCAIGSWNVWTRSCFYEMEHEFLMHSTKIATDLVDRFEREKEKYTVRVWSAEECHPGKGFCPVGCALCKRFGPFYE